VGIILGFILVYRDVSKLRTELSSNPPHVFINLPSLILDGLSSSVEDVDRLNDRNMFSTRCWKTSSDGADYRRV